MKLEVGMYVRTKKGLIAKYTGYEKDEENDEYNRYQFDGKIYWYYEYYNNYVYEENFQEWFEEKVVKVGHNIIDLIEEKDLIEIEYYSPRYEERITRLFEVDFRHKNNITFCNAHCQLNIFDGEWDKHDQLLKPVIKSIVTKEQFENMGYKVGE